MPLSVEESTVDVAALTDLLDGRYAEVRRQVRENLAKHADILVDAEEMSTSDFRDRVRDVLLMMVETGQTGMGFPAEYGGGGDLAPTSRTPSPGSSSAASP